MSGLCKNPIGFPIEMAILYATQEAIEQVRVYPFMAGTVIVRKKNFLSGQRR